MTWGGDWTTGKLYVRLTDAFRALPGRAILVAGRGEIVLVDGDPVTHVQLFKVVDCVLGKQPKWRTALLICMGARVSGASIRAYCREHAISRGTFYRHRDAAATAMVSALGGNRRC